LAFLIAIDDAGRKFSTLAFDNVCFTGMVTLAWHDVLSEGTLLSFALGYFEEILWFLYRDMTLLGIWDFGAVAVFLV